MEKEKEKKTTEVTAENVVEQIKSGNKFEAEIAEEALNQIKKDEKDQKISTLKRAINKTDYDEKKCLLLLRKNRALEKPMKERLKALDDAIKELKTGKVTPIEYNKKCEEIRKNHNKAVSDINEEYDELMRELRTKYPSYWGYDWD